MAPAATGAPEHDRAACAVTAFPFPFRYLDGAEILAGAAGWRAIDVSCPPTLATLAPA